MLLEPLGELLAQGREVRRAALEERRDELDGVGAGHHRLDDVGDGVDAAGAGERRLHLGRQHGEPDEAQRQLGRAREVDLAADLQLLDVDVGLVEPVEEHEAVGARLVELRGEVGERGVVRGELHRHRDADGLADRLHHLDGPQLHLRARLLRVGAEGEDVELEGVGPRVLDELGVLQPAARGVAVERADDGHGHGLLHLAQVLEVLVRAEVERLGAREVGEGLGEGLAVGLGVDEGRHLLPVDLLLEDRVHGDGGGARVLELADGVEVVHEGRGPRHQGVGQLEAEVGRAEVHVCLLLTSSPWPARPRLRRRTPGER